MTTKTKNYSGSPASLDAWWAEMQKADRKEWMRVSAEVGDYVQRLAGRDDLIAVVEPDAPASAGVTRGTLAVWIPERAELRVDTDLCAAGIDPADVHMSTEVGRLKHPALAGGCTHEGFHAFASRWPLDQSPSKRAVVQAALLLEEARCEKRGLSINPGARTFLRAGFFDLVKGNGDPTDIASAAQLAALGMARVDAGVLDADEMEPVKTLLVSLLGQDLYDGLRGVWLKSHDVADDDQAGMEALGQEWLDLLPEEAKEDGGEGGIEVVVCGMPGGEPKPGEDGEGEGSGKGVMAAVAEAVAEAAEAEAEAKVDAAAAHDTATERATEASEAKDAEKAADDVFRGHHSGGAGYEGISGTMPPPAHVRATANVLARAIEKAQHRARSKTVVASAVPPGRLRGAAAVRRSAQRSQGIPVTAEPWKQTVRKHVENPPITVGIACDISGSMRWASTPVAEAAWAIAHAVHRNDGDTATVAYGNRVHAVTKPGERSKVMRTFDANGGTENVRDAIRALDGGLNLASGSGVRMLVNVSDGHYTHHQKAAATKLLKRLIASGVIVIWIDLERGSDPIRLPGLTVVSVSARDDLGRVVGAAITKALSAA